jgi:hypothetical protein
MNQDAVETLRQHGYSFVFRRKIIHVNNMNYEVITCSICQDDESKIIIMPDMVSPHRPYPIFAYIFAIALYELIPKMTQRRAAKITRDCFGLGLKQFSASTLCRARKKLKESTAEMAAAIAESIDNRQRNENGDENDQAMTVLKQIDNCNEEYTAGTVSAPIKHDASAQSVESDKIKPTLEEVFNTCPYIAQFINMYSSGNTIPLNEKLRFSAYIGQFNRKFYLLNRRLLI